MNIICMNVGNRLKGVKMFSDHFINQFKDSGRLNRNRL